MYGLTELGGLVAGEGVAVIGPGPIGLLGVAVARRRASPVILIGTRDSALHIGQELGTDHLVNGRTENPVSALRRITGEHRHRPCAGMFRRTRAMNHAANDVARRELCLAAFPQRPAMVDIAYIMRNNIYVYGLRGEGKSATHRAAALMSQKRFDQTRESTRTRLDCAISRPLAALCPPARYNAIKVVVTTRNVEQVRAAAE